MEGRERKKDKGGEERGMIGTVKTRGAHTHARARRCDVKPERS